jgi:Vacuolar protein sorting-associated protein 62
VPRLLARILEFGGAAIVIFLAGFALGAGLLFWLHTQHWLGNVEVRTKAAFSEVPEPEAGRLAETFRPWLKFDSQEQWRPLAIAQLFDERINGQPAHQFCWRPPAEPSCTPIYGEQQFDQLVAGAGSLGSSSYIDLAGSKLADYHGPDECGDLLDCGTGPSSAIYYHVTESNDRFYIDYWWFLRFNHFYRSDPSLSCKSPLAQKNSICDEHEGDWEGVTAVTAPGDPARLDYVVYAAHKGTFRYAASEIGMEDGTRPVVYVARGSHASYPKPCSSDCSQPIALAAKGLLTLPESSFDGQRDWARNSDDCPVNAPGSCLLSLPRTDQNPRAWAVWPGQWGNGCGDVCGGPAQVGSPLSPGVQPRYQTPWCSTQGSAFTCDSVALGCSDWLGPLVVAVGCDPIALANGLSSTESTSPGNLRLSVRRRTSGSEKASTETTPGVVQALGEPLAPGDSLRISGSGQGLQVLVRAEQGPYLVEARFGNVDVSPGSSALARIGSGPSGPMVRLDGREPVEVRTLTVSPPTKGAG